MNICEELQIKRPLTTSGWMGREGVNANLEKVKKRFIALGERCCDVIPDTSRKEAELIYTPMSPL
jgi:hypothetical protein